MVEVDPAVGLVVGLVLGGILYALWSFTPVGPDETGSLLQRSRPKRTLTPGWYFPWKPVQRVEVTSNRSRSVNPSATIYTDADGGEWLIDLVRPYGPARDVATYMYRVTNPYGQLAVNMGDSVQEAISGFHTQDLLSQSNRFKVVKAAERRSDEAAIRLGLEPRDDMRVSRFEPTGATRAALDRVIAQKAETESDVIAAEGEARITAIERAAQGPDWLRKERIDAIRHASENGATIIFDTGDERESRGNRLLEGLLGRFLTDSQHKPDFSSNQPRRMKPRRRRNS